MLNTRTVVNGVELIEYDKFRDLLGLIEQSIISQNDYAGFPKSPDNFWDAYEIFDAATDEEKRHMFGLLWGYFVSALQHWKVDLDALWTEEGRKKHQEFLNRYKDIMPYLKKDMDSFNIGIN